MQVCSGHGLQDQDHSALVKALEIMGNHQVAPDPAA
jgi:2-hydroxy-3-oxopropionate reductase